MAKSVNASQGELKDEFLARLASADGQAVFEYLLAFAESLDGYKCELRRQGYLRTFQYTRAGSWPYGFIVNKTGVLFYIRKPGQGSQELTTAALSRHFADVTLQRSGREVKVRLSDVASAKRLMQVVFGRA
jgi:hypothetical protein